MTTRTVEQWLITAPQETFEALMDVGSERSRQEDNGWTPEHDDAHGIAHLIEEASLRLSVANYKPEGGHPDTRAALVQAAALLVAAIEVFDRGSEEDR